MPVIKANIITSPKRKPKKSSDEGPLSDGEMLEFRHTSKKNDVSSELLKLLQGTVLKEMREIGNRLRLDIKKDVQGVMTDFGSLHTSPRSDGPGHRSQVRDLSGGLQEIHIPPRCVTAPPGIGRPGAFRRSASMDAMYQRGGASAPTNSRPAKLKPDPLPAKRGAPLGKPKELPGQFPLDTELHEDCLSDERGTKPDKAISSWVAEAWQADFSDAKPPGDAMAQSDGWDQEGITSKESDASRTAMKAQLSRGMTVHRRKFDDEARQFIEDSVVQHKEVGRLKRMVLHDHFDYLMAALIITNSFLIGVQTQVHAVSDKKQDTTKFDLWTAIDLMFSLIFGVELILRLVAFRAEFFYIEGWAWNIFDTVCVSFSVLDVITDYLLGGTNVKQALDNLSILRVLRLFRILRLVRMVRFIPALKSMVYLIAASLQSFFWTLVLIVGVMYIYAVYLTEIATELKHDGKSTDTIQTYWGDLFTSISTLFQAITGGDDWHNFISGFKEVEGDKYIQNLIFFILYIAFASLVLMNLVTGVFVEGAQRIAAEEKRQDLQKQVRKIVQVSKYNINASIGWDDFNEQLITKEMESYLKAFQMDQSQAKDIFYILDDMRTGTITMKDFFSACMQLHGAVRLSDTEILRHRLMHSISDMNERMDSLEDLIMRAQTQSNRAPAPESPVAKDFPGGNVVQPFSPGGGVPGTAPGFLQQRAQSPMPFPLPPNISGYLLKTGNNKHMVRWIG